MGAGSLSRSSRPGGQWGTRGWSVRVLGGTEAPSSNLTSSHLQSEEGPSRAGRPGSDQGQRSLRCGRPSAGGEACGHVSLDRLFLGPSALLPVSRGLGVVGEGGGPREHHPGLPPRLSRLAILGSDGMVPTLWAMCPGVPLAQEMSKVKGQQCSSSGRWGQGNCTGD